MSDSDIKEELKNVFASAAGVQLLIMILRVLAERTDNQLDDMLVDGIEAALSAYA